MKIVFLDEYSLGDMDLTPIKELGEYVGYDRTSKEQVLERCKGAEVVICNKTVLRAETLRALPDLRFIAIAATGMNNVDLDTAAELLELHVVHTITAHLELLYLQSLGLTFNDYE